MLPASDSKANGFSGHDTKGTPLAKLRSGSLMILLLLPRAGEASTAFATLAWDDNQETIERKLGEPPFQAFGEVPLLEFAGMTWTVHYRLQGKRLAEVVLQWTGGRRVALDDLSCRGSPPNAFWQAWRVLKDAHGEPPRPGSSEVPGREWSTQNATISMRGETRRNSAGDICFEGSLGPINCDESAAITITGRWVEAERRKAFSGMLLYLLARSAQSHR